MLYHLLAPLRHEITAFNVVRYPSFRIIAAMITAMMLSFLLYPWFIRRLARGRIGQNVRDDGPQSHLSKAGTPTMGGSMILFSMVVPSLLWADLTNHFIWIVLTITMGYGVIGFVDDMLKIKGKNAKGLRGKYKLLWQIAVAGGTTFFLFYYLEFDTNLWLPFLKVPVANLPWWLYILLASFVIVGSSNSVNLTDGLDGLAIGPTIIAAGTFLLLAYAAGTVLTPLDVPDATQFNIAKYLKIPHIKGAGELAVFCGAMIGAGVGFLWYNTYPAQVFMGDVGSLSLGGALGTLAVLTKNEFLLVIIGGIFVIEALSVITQVVSFKLTGKRVFRMAPLHHHFELKGWPEPRIIVRFWVISIILALLAIATLKLR